MPRSTATNDAVLRLPTCWGTVEVTAREGVIVRCALPAVGPAPRRPLTIGRAAIRARAARDARALRAAERFLRRALRGRPARPPAWRWPADAAPFTQRVWRALARVPHGTTVTYGELARRIGRAGAARAVGGACGANPLPLWMPCHRVVAAGGRLGGFSGGVGWKKWLLEGEKRL